MKRTTIVKLLIDVTMTVLYLLLMFAGGLGGFFHEIAGIGFCVIYIVHILLNRPMMRGLFKGAKSANRKPDRVILLISDIVMMICMPIVVLTGVFIARELFVIDIGLPWDFIFSLHNTLSYVCLGTMALHLLLHAKYLIGVFKKLPSVNGKEVRSALYRFGAGAAAAITIYVSVYSVLNGNMTNEPLASSDKNNNTPKPTEPTATAPTTEVLTQEQSISTTLPITEDYFANTDSEITDETQQTTDEQIEMTTQQPQEEQTQIEPVTEEETEEIPSLEEFLSGMYCTGCGKHCSLLSPRCGKGEAQAEQAQYEYEQLYYSN